MFPAVDAAHFSAKLASEPGCARLPLCELQTNIHGLLQAPGIETLRNPKDLTPSDAVGVAVKGVAELILAASRKV